MSDMFKNKNAEPELFTQIYGRQVLRSDYTLMKAIYQTTPSNITLLTPSNRAAAIASIIVIKAIAPPTTDSAIYEIRSNDFQGFQLGEPSRRPTKMCLELYGEDVEFEFNFGQSKAGPSSAISQAELNRVIQSAHKAAITQSTLTVKAPGQPMLTLDPG